MPSQIGSLDYMTKDYVAHQQQYRTTPRESDRVIFELLEREGLAERDAEVLDIGCHMGNLLYHLKQRFPRLRLTGADVVAEVISECHKDPALADVEFRTMNVLSLPVLPQVDCVIANALLGRFRDQDFERAWRGMYEVIRPGGIAVAFDWYHPFSQTLRIVEETPTHPDGLVIHMRSLADVRGLLERIGFSSVDSRPFELGIDLPLTSPTDALHTHTRTVGDGSRLQFRGALYQPWCHLVARK